jgi:hypothetical protein
MADGCKPIFTRRIRGQKPAIKPAIEKWTRILQTVLVLLLSGGLLGCIGPSEVLMHKSVSQAQAMDAPATLWLGSRSASVVNSNHFEKISGRLVQRFEDSGYDVIDNKSAAEYRAYVWFGKRGERREQFSNVTDGISIATEYTWAATLEITQRQIVGQKTLYLGEVEAAVWCPSINSVLDELVEELVLGFPTEESYEASVLVPYAPNKC